MTHFPCRLQQHCTDVAYHAVQKLNPGQVLVYEADQPLYAIILQKKFKYLCQGMDSTRHLILSGHYTLN